MERERCPKCAAKGQDTKGDNLAVYPDKHKFCFACGYREGVPVIERIRQIQYEIEPMLSVDQTFDFPEDYTTDLPAHVIRWVKSYGITDDEIRSNRFGWSNTKGLLIFPVFDGDGNLIMWQGRKFSPSKPMSKVTEDGKTQPRYITNGPSSDVMHLVGQSTSEKDTVILTEDLLSAIKVGRVYQAMPLWGSHIPLKLIQRLSTRFKQVGIWLDSDKTDVALRAALRASQYVKTFVVLSTFDPKEYTASTIQELVQAASLDSVAEDMSEAPPVDMGAIVRKIDYAEARRRFPAHIKNLTDYCKIRNSFDNVKEHEVRGPYEA